MRAFAEAYPEAKIVQAVLAQITWYHNIALLDKVKDKNERLWYAQEIVNNGWSRNVLVHQIELKLYKRQMKNEKTHNFKATLPAVQTEKVYFISRRICCKKFINFSLLTGFFVRKISGVFGRFLEAVDDR